MAIFSSQDLLRLSVVMAWLPAWATGAMITATPQPATTAGQTHPEATTLKDALVCKARQRILDWYVGGQKATHVMYSGNPDGIEFRFMNELVPCGGEDSVVAFANFTVPGVKPLHYLSTVADPNEIKLSWNPSQASDYELVYDDVKNMARGLKVAYSATPFPNRKFYLWEAFDFQNNGSTVWSVSSNLGNSILKTKDTQTEAGGWFGLFTPVEAQNCLSAHYLRETPDGSGTEVFYTSHINPKAPLGLSASLVSQHTWSMMVNFIKACNARAKVLAARGPMFVAPPFMVAAPACIGNCEASVSKALQNLGLQATLAAVMTLDETQSRSTASDVQQSVRRHTRLLAATATVMGGIVAMIAAAVTVIRCRLRHSHAQRCRSHRAESHRSLQEDRSETTLLEQMDSSEAAME